MLSGWSSPQVRGACPGDDVNVPSSSGFWMLPAPAMAPCSSCTATPASARPLSSSRPQPPARGSASFWAAGGEGEMELDYAVLQQLCSPLLGLTGHLHEPQRKALSTAFGLSTGGAPTALLWGWRPSASFLKRPRTSPSCASSTTRSGWMTHRPKPSRSLADRPRKGSPRVRTRTWCDYLRLRSSPRPWDAGLLGPLSRAPAQGLREARHQLTPLGLDKAPGSRRQFRLSWTHQLQKAEPSPLVPQPDRQRDRSATWSSASRPSCLM